MDYIRKLKNSQSITGPVQPVIVLAIFAIVFFVAGLAPALAVLSLIYFLYFLSTLVACIRTSNPYFLVVAFFQLFCALWLLTNPKGYFYFGNTIFSIFTVAFIISALGVVYVLLGKKVKWRGREVLELAAKNVPQAGESFTERPKPVAQIAYDDQEVLEFTSFLSKNLIALPYFEENRVMLVLILAGEEYRYLYFKNRNLQDSTWVAFDADRNVSVNISKESYLQYKDDLSFDSLCQSLGDLFIRFFEEYKKGREVRVIDTLNDLKVNIFT